MFFAGLAGSASVIWSKQGGELEGHDLRIRVSLLAASDGPPGAKGIKDPGRHPATVRILSSKRLVEQNITRSQIDHHVHQEESLGFRQLPGLGRSRDLD